MTSPDTGWTVHGCKVPVLLQQERAECGPVCLAMIAGYFGKRISLVTLRHECAFSGKGTTVGDLLGIAGQLQLTARPVRLGLADLSKLRLPAVLHWNMNHFVVLVKAGRRKFLVHDPALGSRKVGRAEMSKAFTGVAVELTRRKDFATCKGRRGLRMADFVVSFSSLYRYLGVVFLLLLTTQILALVPSVATQIVIDEVVLGQDRAWLYRALGGLAIVMLTTSLLESLRGWISLFAGTRLAVDSTVSMVSHLFSLPAEFVHRRHLGDLLSKLESLTPIRQALTAHGIAAIVQIVVMTTTLAIMFLYSPWLTAVSVAGLFASVLVVLLALPRDRRLNEQALVHQAMQNSSIVETLKGYETVRCLGLTESRRLHWQDRFVHASLARMAQGKLAIVRSAAMGIIATAEQVAFLGVGIGGLLDKEITLGAMFAFVVLRSRFGAAALRLTDLLHRFSILKVHTERLADIALAPPIPSSPAGAVTSALVGAVSVSDLTFGYDAGSPIIRNLHCEIAAGSNAVITGPSGCGKTTLLKILANQLPIVSGNVRVDGIELTLWNRNALTAQCALVLQSDRLFQGSIVQNITAFSASPDLARLRIAAINADIWADILDLPMQTATMIGDSEAALSGGQVQRLAIARALYRQPRILFLDEATSHLDVETEQRVLQNIGRLNITVISVAHRPDAIAQAGQVISLQPH